MKVPNVFIANDNLIKLRLICLSDSDSFFSLAKKLIDYLVICITYFFGVLFVFYALILVDTAVTVPLTAISARFPPRAASSVVYASVISTPFAKFNRIPRIFCDKTYESCLPSLPDNASLSQFCSFNLVEQIAVLLYWTLGKCSRLG